MNDNMLYLLRKKITRKQDTSLIVFYTRKISITIDLYYEDNYRVGGLRQELGSNLCLFSVFGHHVPLTVEKVRAVVTDKKTGEVKSLLIRPNWKTKVYHGKLPSEFPFSPEKTTRQLVRDMVDNGTDSSRVQPLVLNKVRNQFPWENLQHQYWQKAHREEMEYQGNYKGYQDVY
ncbi:MAG: hypothetical protein PHT79_11850 [Syntrophomonadaceae bacterium]|nr:hypothetical protein [Syntrophomonadaceae bacterium]MDD3890249.1 hypothetical protein [Syntrophomonadaceae bacterium]MDD4550437.1 hypothetical protein [Syntrophomonadaceae bacterium]